MDSERGKILFFHMCHESEHNKGDEKMLERQWMSDNYILWSSLGHCYQEKLPFQYSTDLRKNALFAY